MSSLRCSFHACSDIPKLDQALEKTDLVVAYDGWPGSSAKRFAVVNCLGRERQQKHECSFIHIAKMLTDFDQHRYEVLLNDKPSRLFFDVEWLDDGQVTAKDPLSTLLSLLDEYCYGSAVFAKRTIMTCRRPESKKRSFHVVFPDAVFRCVPEDMKIFVLGFARWLVDEHDGAGLTYEKIWKSGKRVPMTVIDTAVYTKNICFRMRGQSKRSDKTRTPMTSVYGVAATDTIVQNSRWIRTTDETLSVIDSILERQKPPIGDYAVRPICTNDDGSSRLHWSVRTTATPPETNTTDNITSQSTPKTTSYRLSLIGRKLANTSVTVRSSLDIANAIDSRLLREIDYAGLFLPVLASLCSEGTLSDEFLLGWIGSADSIKVRRRLDYGKTLARRRDYSTVRCDAALRFLKKLNARVIDSRFDARLAKPLLVPIEPSATDGWIPIEAGEALRQRIQKMCGKDGRTVGTRNETKRLFVISGKMGAGKTKAVLEFAVDWMKTGVFANVTYLGPRKILVENVCQHVERHNAAKGMCDVLVDRIYDGAVNSYEDWYENGDSRESGIFTGACINSVHKTPKLNDVVIVDEIATDIGNIFLNWSQRLRDASLDATGRIHEPIDAAKDKFLIDTIADRMWNARIVFAMDAAIPSELLDACVMLCERRGVDLELRSYIEQRGANGFAEGDCRDWKEWIREQQRTTMRKHGGSSTSRLPMIDPETKRVYRRAELCKLAVYDPNRTSGVFSKLEEVATLDDIKADLLECAVGDARQRAVIYVSSTRTGVQLANAFFANIDDADRAPKVLTVNATTIHTLGRQRVMNEIETCRFLIVSNVLSSGYSFELPDVFDVAYAVFEFSPNTPPLADMIQLCARVRSVGTRTLKYTVVSHAYASSIAKDSLESAALEHRGKTLNHYPAERALHEYHVKQFYEHKRHCADVAYARPCARDALVQAFSHANTVELKYERTELVVRQRRTAENVAALATTAYRIRKYQQLLRQLPLRVVLVGFQGTSRRVLVPNVNSTRTDYERVAADLPLMPLDDGRGELTDRVVPRNGKRKWTAADTTRNTKPRVETT